MEKIFVQIASYRDPECQWTIKNLYEKARHPERIFIGICWQFDEEEDKNCFTEPYPYPAQVRTLKFHPRESQGSGWAHMQAQSLWNGEDYVLQIQAHMRFEQDWDETLIDMLARCPSEKAALSTCLPGYTPPDNFPFRDTTRASFIFVNAVKPAEPQLVTLQGALVDKNEAMAGPTHTPFWAGTFLFAKAALLKDVPFDPHIMYYGEPIAYSARIFTHGYDLFEPDQLVLYHWWGHDFAHPRPYREMGTERQKHSFMRLKHVLRLESAPESAALTEIEIYGLGTARSIDDFWQFAGIDILSGTMTEFAHKGRWNQAHARYLQYKAQPEKKQPRIFVQIASYRDPECQWTVKDLFEKAKYPDRVFVGICWQHDPEEDQDYFKISTRPEQVRTALFHWKESQGVCWARHQTQLLWEGEEYTLMIDSHMRFAFNWDEHFINDLAMCPSPKAVLSNYPAAYTPPHNLELNAKPTVQRAHPYEDGDIRFRGDTLDRLPPAPLRGAFIAAGLMFGKSELIREVPYDPYLYFNQEELSLAARLFTHGWDVYSMRQVLIYHLYITNPAANKRPLHWQDNTKWGEMQERARKRMDHMMGYTLSDDPTITRDLAQYGLGTERSLDAFSAFCGVDFKNRKISERALRCEFVPDLYKYKNDKIFIPEVDGTLATVQAASQTLVMGFPDPEESARQPFNVMLRADGSRRMLTQNVGAPEHVLIIPDFLEHSLAASLLKHVGKSADIDAIAGVTLNIFNDIFCHRISPFYSVAIESYERPYILKDLSGLGIQCDAEELNTKTKRWERTHNRDYTAFLCLSGGNGNSVFTFTTQDYKIVPTAGMLIAFPSDHRFQYTAQGDDSFIMTSAAAKGTPRLQPIPQDSVYLGQKRFG